MMPNFNRPLKQCIARFWMFAVFFLLSCSGGTEVGNPVPPVEVPLTADEELETYIKDQYATSVFSSDAYYFEATTVDSQMAEVFAEAAPAPGDSGAEMSRTNIQEAGVDESDKVKFDSTYMYVADERKISIVQAVPPDAMSLSSTIDVNGYVDSLYLYGDILAVLYTPDGGDGEVWGGTSRTEPADVGMPYWLPVKAQTGLLLMDVTNPSAPERITEMVADGSFVSSRLTGGKLHIIQQFLPQLPALSLSYEGTESDRNAAIQANRDALAPLSLDDLIPLYKLVDQNGSTLEDDRLVAVEDFYQPDDPEGGSIATITTFDMDRPDEPHQSIGIIADIHLIYASSNALYTTVARWNPEADGSALYDQRQQTVIHRFNLGVEGVTFSGKGQVQGRILNQFSLGEYAGVLRIATTTGNDWWTNTGLSNHVYCLQEEGDSLVVIGRLEGIAPGETLYSARFVGTRGFLVTFVRVDPLFTLDLADPTDPKIAGELKVPGFSEYIHPLGEDHLLTIGKDTLEQEGFVWVQGVQLSVFDISDFSNPSLLHKEIVGVRGTGSEALYNHKAFTFWAERDLLAIPVRLYEYANPPENAWDWAEQTFSGVMVYRITIDGGFGALGRISTSTDQGYDYGWTRGAFVDSSVYAVKSSMIRSAEIDDIANTVTEILLP